MEIKKISNQSILDALEGKGVNLPCHRCGSKLFDLVSTTIIPINKNPDTLMAGEQSIPAVIVACSNCGVLSMHALGPLGLVDLEGK